LLKKTLKYLGITVGVLLGLFLIVVLLLQFPPVQTWVTQKITNNLSQKLNSEVHIQSVAIDFFKTVVLEEIYIADQSKDTLLYAKKLATNIGLFSLWKKNIFLNKIELERATINLSKNAIDSTFNFDYLIRHFQSPTTDTTATPWTFSLGELALKNAQLNFQDELTSNVIKVQIGNLAGKANIIDFNQKIIDLQNLTLNNALVDYQIEQREEDVIATKDSLQKPTITFPEIGWNLAINQINLTDNQFVFYNKNKRIEKRYGINFQDLNFSEITLLINDFSWKKKAIAASIDRFACNEKSGFKLQEFKAALKADSVQLNIENLLVETPYSRLENTTNLRWERFNDFVKLNEKIYFQTIFDDVNIAFHDLKLWAPAIENLQQLNTDVEERLFLKGTIRGNRDSLTINNLQFKIGEAVELLLAGQINNPIDLEQATFNLQLEKLSTSYQKMNRITDNLSLPEGLDAFGQFTLSGNLDGQVSDFNFNDLFLTTASNTQIKANAYLVGLPNTDYLRFDLDIDTLKTRAADWAGFMNNKVPSILERLGKIHFGGKVEGDMHSFLLKGNLHSEIGNLVNDFQLDFTPDYKSGDYKGKLTLIDFDLSQAFPENDKLGKTSLRLEGKGSGFALETLIADAQVVIDSIDYNNYRYRTVKVDGKFDKKNFDGSIHLADKNAQLDFEGQVNLSDSIPEFNFALALDRLNLLPLNFTKEELSFSFNAAIDFRGNKLNNMLGKSIVSNFKISGPEDFYEEDSIILTASQPDLDSTHISLKSDFLTADMHGDIDVADLPKVIINYVNDYFPVYDLLDTTFQSEVVAVNEMQQAFNFEISITNPTPLTLVFLPKLTQLEDALIFGNFNRQQQLFNLDAIVDVVEFAGVYSDQMVLTAEGVSENLQANIALLDVHSGIMASPLAILETNLKDDSLRFRLNVLGDTLDQRLDVRGIVYETEKWYEGKLTEDYVLNTRPWQVSADNAIYFWDKNWYVNNLAIREGKHEVIIQSEASPWDRISTPPIKIIYDDFEMADVTNFVDLNPERIKGLINGELTIKEPFGNLHYLADLQVNELKLNNDPIGRFFLDSQLEADRKTIQLTTALMGKKNKFSIGGNYRIQERKFDLEGTIDSLEMRLLNPFTKRIVSDSKGKISGDFSLEGSPQNPEVNGQLKLEKASTVVDYLGTRIYIPNHLFYMDNRTIQIGNLQVRDETGQKGVIKGIIQHDFFTDFDLKLKFQSDAFQVLNTTAEQNPLYYGQIFAAVTAAVAGELQVPNIQIKAKTLSNSVFNLQPLLESELLTNDDYILFISPEKYAIEGDNAFRYRFRNAFNLNLDIDIEVTPDALVRIIIDPETADQVEGRGLAGMSFGLSRMGYLKILGDFVITEGQYNFNYQNLVKKNFEISPNSRVRFYGNPRNAQFDITAKYKVKTNTYELIKNETTFNSLGEAQAARRRSDIETLLYLKGPLTKPEIDFDIQLADNATADVSSTFVRKLNELRNDPDEMNKQVFALLLFNSFLATENAGISLAETGQKVAFSSVSKLVSNQLNQLATQHVKGLELTFDLSSYETSVNNVLSSTVELGLGVSQKLFNDRVTIKADADINLSDQRPTSGSNIIGDFILEYELTPKGDYLLRVFHLSEFDILTDQNTGKTGVGIDFRKSFGNVLKRKGKED